MKKNKCPVCEEMNYNFLPTHSRSIHLPSPFSIIKCNECGLVRLYPRPTSKDYEKHYSESNYYSQKEYSGRAKAKNSVFEDRLTNIECYIAKKNNKKILDFGCAGGDFLVVAKKRGWGTVGIEPTLALAEKAKLQVGNKIFKSLRIANKNIGLVDCVHSNHSFEHVQDPLKVANYFSSLLRPEGILSIEVPYQFGSWISFVKLTLYKLCDLKILLRVSKKPVDMLHHTYFYTPKTLCLILEKAGFEIEFISTINKSYYKSKLLSPVKRYLYKYGDRIASYFNRGQVIVCFARKK